MPDPDALPDDTATGNQPDAQHAMLGSDYTGLCAETDVAYKPAPAHNVLGEAALKYAQQGFTVFPCKPRGKDPLTQHGLHDATTDLNQVRSWWKKWPDANIGWAIPPTLVVIDHDAYKQGGEVEMATLVAERGPLPSTKEHISGGDTGNGKSRHRIYRIDGVDPAKLRGKLGETIDIKKSGGYIVLPPSVHNTGRQYLDATPGDSPVPLPNSWLQAALKPEPKQAAQTDWKSPAAAEHPYVRAALDNELSDLASMPPESGRNIALNDTAVSLGRFACLDREWLRGQLMACMEANGYTHSDPGKAEGTIASAFAYADTQPAREIPEGDYPNGETLQFDPAAVLDAARAGAAEAAVADLLADAFDLASLLEQHFAELEYIVPGVLPEGATLLSAPPKIGKSWFCLQLAIECVLGGRFLGQQLKQRPTLYLALEDGQRRLKDRALQLLKGRFPGAGMLTIKLAATPQLAIAIVLDYLERHPGEKPLVIIDTLGRIKPQKRAGDESYLSDYKFASDLRMAISTRPGAALLAIHHTRKAEVEDFVEAGSGTLGLAGAFDTVIVLKRKRHEQTGVLLVSGRDVEEGRYALRVDDGCWQLDAPTLLDASELAAHQVTESEVSARYSPRTKQVLQVVRDRAANGEVTTPNDVVQQTHVPRQQVANVLKRLMDAGHVVKLAFGAYTVPGAPTSDSGDVGDSGDIAGQNPFDVTTSTPSGDVGPQAMSPLSPLASNVTTSDSAADLRCLQLHQLHHNPVQGAPDGIKQLPGRCAECGWHIETQGHAANCPALEEES